MTRKARNKDRLTAIVDEQHEVSNTSAEPKKLSEAEMYYVSTPDPRFENGELKDG